MVLTKDELLNGSQNIIEFTPSGREGSVFLRPLTIGEINQIEEAKSKALGTYTANEVSHRSKRNVKGKLEAQAKVNIAKTTIADNKANVKAVLLSLTNEKMPFKLSEEEILDMDKPVFYSILDKVKEISHWDDDFLEDDVEDFPQDE